VKPRGHEAARKAHNMRNRNKGYTVKQLSDLAGVSVRTLHYYDAIGLLAPSRIGANGYRYYDDQAVLRLQQILFYREIGLELVQIKTILDNPNFDLLTALHGHRAQLEAKISHLSNLVATIDRTIKHLTGEEDMSKNKKKLFQGFSPKKQERYERVARLQYGPDIVNESAQRWASYTETKKEAIFAEGNAIYSDLADALQAGHIATSAKVQSILVRWHDHLRYFYDPKLEILRGLGALYQDDAAFAANFQKLHPDLPAFLHEAITCYVDTLENIEIARLLPDDVDDNVQSPKKQAG